MRVEGLEIKGFGFRVSGEPFRAEGLKRFQAWNLGRGILAVGWRVED